MLEHGRHEEAVRSDTIAADRWLMDTKTGVMHGARMHAENRALVFAEEDLSLTHRAGRVCAL